MLRLFSDLSNAFELHEALISFIGKETCHARIKSGQQSPCYMNVVHDILHVSSLLSESFLRDRKIFVLFDIYYIIFGEPIREWTTRLSLKVFRQSPGSQGARDLDPWEVW